MPKPPRNPPTTEPSNLTFDFVSHVPPRHSETSASTTAPTAPRMPDTARESHAPWQAHPTQSSPTLALPQGYKQTEVGVIPEDWEVNNVGFLCSKVGSGLTPRGGERVYKPTGRFFVRSQNVGWGKMFLEDVVYIDEDTHASFQETEIQENDVLLNITGASIGRCALADARVAGGNVNQHVCILRTQLFLAAPYLKFVLLSALGQKQIDSFQTAGNRQGLNFSQIRSVLVPLPPMEEQEAIAEALSDADALVDALERLLWKKRRIKEGAMQELLTGRTRLVGFVGDWEECTYLSVVNHHSGNSLLIKGKLENSSTGQYPAYSASGQDIWRETYDFEGEALIVSAVGSRCGRVFFANRKWSAIANTHIIWPLLYRVSTRFLHHLINNEEFWMKGGSGQPFVLFKQSLAQKLLLPPLEEQEAIAEVLCGMDEEIEALEEKLAKARMVKQGMMQELLTGRIRLR